ncbi:MAG TPA: IS630 family transposase, partial [Nitrososphaera sp.]|nr:IS630 family transposase [Nitrososphaera sp.]
CRSRKSRAEDVKRARVILLLSKGRTYVEIREMVDCSFPFISQWKKRFAKDRIAGLIPLYKGRTARVLDATLEAKILSATRKKPSDGSTHWTTRKLARYLGINHMLVARAWRRAGVRPHRMKRYMVSTDPAFESKAADIIGLYLNPPQHAAVFCVDEKTAIQALDRLDPVLPLSPGRAERHGFEYYRHGTLSLYAALETKSGQVLGKTAQRHTSAEFVEFLKKIVNSQSREKEIHIIVDNLSAHKTQAVTNFLQENPNVKIHFTPTYSSWLNQVETWFSKIERDVIARGIFTSVQDLARKLVRYIRLYNRYAKGPRKNKYPDKVVDQT